MNFSRRFGGHAKVPSMDPYALDLWKKIRDSVPYLEKRLEQIQTRNEGRLLQQEVSDIKFWMTIAKEVRADIVYGTQMLEASFDQITEMARKHPISGLFGNNDDSCDDEDEDILGANNNEDNSRAVPGSSFAQSERPTENKVPLGRGRGIRSFNDDGPKPVSCDSSQNSSSGPSSFSSTDNRQPAFAGGGRGRGRGSFQRKDAASPGRPVSQSQFPNHSLNDLGIRKSLSPPPPAFRINSNNEPHRNRSPSPRGPSHRSRSPNFARDPRTNSSPPMQGYRSPNNEPVSNQGHPPPRNFESHHTSGRHDEFSGTYGPTQDSRFASNHSPDVRAGPAPPQYNPANYSPANGPPPWMPRVNMPTNLPTNPPQRFVNSPPNMQNCGPQYFNAHVPPMYAKYAEAMQQQPAPMNFQNDPRSRHHPVPPNFQNHVANNLPNQQQHLNNPRPLGQFRGNNPQHYQKQGNGHRPFMQRNSNRGKGNGPRHPANNFPRSQPPAPRNVSIPAPLNPLNPVQERLTQISTGAPGPVLVGNSQNIQPPDVNAVDWQSRVKEYFHRRPQNFAAIKLKSPHHNNTNRRGRPAVRRGAKSGQTRPRYFNDQATKSVPSSPEKPSNESSDVTNGETHAPELNNNYDSEVPSAPASAKKRRASVLSPTNNKSKEQILNRVRANLEHDLPPKPKESKLSQMRREFEQNLVYRLGEKNRNNTIQKGPVEKLPEDAAPPAQELESPKKRVFSRSKSREPSSDLKKTARKSTSRSPQRAKKDSENEHDDDDSEEEPIRRTSISPQKKPKRIRRIESDDDAEQEDEEKDEGQVSTDEATGTEDQAEGEAEKAEMTEHDLLVSLVRKMLEESDYPEEDIERILGSPDQLAEIMKVMREVCTVQTALSTENPAPPEESQPCEPVRQTAVVNRASDTENSSRLGDSNASTSTSCSTNGSESSSAPIQTKKRKQSLLTESPDKNVGSSGPPYSSRSSPTSPSLSSSPPAKKRSLPVPAPIVQKKYSKTASNSSSSSSTISSASSASSSSSALSTSSSSSSSSASSTKTLLYRSKPNKKSTAVHPSRQPVDVLKPSTLAIHGGLVKVKVEQDYQHQVRVKREPEHNRSQVRNESRSRTNSSGSTEYQSGDGPLRRLLIPSETAQKFLRLADRNTREDLETCGYLFGRLLPGSKELVVTHLVIPKQSGTPNSCEVRNEEDIVGCLANKELIKLGWIHTHPSQSAFLSSVDLHTHFWCQREVPEAVAIVCAPKFNQIKTFMIEPAIGMDVLGRCNDPAPFHPHPGLEAPLFTEATHCIYDNDIILTVKDLRTSK